jgi:UDP-GlcNAc:undecaprenyl-phosphate GlcNAc-1-phosphate transferase
MRKVALKINFIDVPNTFHKSHKEPVPYLGGVAIILGTVGTSYAAILTQENFKQYLSLANSLFIPAIALGIVGLIDDKKALPPFPRFVVQTAAGVFTAILIISTNTVGNPSGYSSLDLFITVFWVIGICNSINFFDNIDGGAAGAISASSFGLFLIANQNKQYLIAGASITLFAALLAFLIWNKSPAKIYMGDAGALFIGAVVATLTIRLDPSTDTTIASFTIPIFLLALPLLDTSVAVISRILRKKSIFQGGRDHLSHRLLRQGISKPITVYILWFLSVIFSCAAISISYFQFSSNNLIAVFSILWALLLLGFLRISNE